MYKKYKYNKLRQLYNMDQQAFKDICFHEDIDLEQTEPLEALRLLIDKDTDEEVVVNNVLILLGEGLKMYSVKDRSQVVIPEPIDLKARLKNLDDAFNDNNIPGETAEEKQENLQRMKEQVKKDAQDVEDKQKAIMESPTDKWKPIGHGGEGSLYVKELGDKAIVAKCSLFKPEEADTIGIDQYSSLFSELYFMASLSYQCLASTHYTRLFPDIIGYDVNLQFDKDRRHSQYTQREMFMSRYDGETAKEKGYGVGPGNFVNAYMEYIPGKPIGKYTTTELSKQLWDDGPTVLSSLITQLSYALAFIHRLGYVYCDVKSDNILIVEEDGKYRLVLIDYGAVYRNVDARLGKTEPYKGRDSSNCCGDRFMGTIGFVAPEVFEANYATQYPPAAIDKGARANEMITGIKQALESMDGVDTQNEYATKAGLTQEEVSKVRGDEKPLDSMAYMIYQYKYPTFGTNYDWWAMGILILGLLLEGAPLTNTQGKHLVEYRVWDEKYGTPGNKFEDHIQLLRNKTETTNFLKTRLEAVPEYWRTKMAFVRSLLSWDQYNRCQASLVGDTTGNNLRTLEWKNCSLSSIHDFFRAPVYDRTFSDSLRLFGESVKEPEFSWGNTVPSEEILVPKEFILFQGWLLVETSQRWVVVTTGFKCYLFHYEEDSNRYTPEEEQERTLNAIYYANKGIFKDPNSWTRKKLFGYCGNGTTNYKIWLETGSDIIDLSELIAVEVVDHKISLKVRHSAEVEDFGVFDFKVLAKFDGITYHTADEWRIEFTRLKERVARLKKKTSAMEKNLSKVRQQMENYDEKKIMNAYIEKVSREVSQTEDAQRKSREIIQKLEAAITGQQLQEVQGGGGKRYMKTKKRIYKKKRNKRRTKKRKTKKR